VADRKSSKDKSDSERKSEDVTDPATDPEVTESAEKTQSGSTADTDTGDTDDDSDQLTDSETPGPKETDREADTPEADATDPVADAGQPDSPDDERQNDPAQAAPVASQPVPVEQVIVHKGGFMPTLLGGVAAAAIGFGAAQYVSGGWPFASITGDGADQALGQQLDAQSAQIEDIQGRLDALGDGPDLGGLEETQAGQAAAIDTVSQRLNEAMSRLDELETRLGEVESRPSGEGATQAIASDVAAELNTLRESIAQQGDEISRMVEDARTMEENAEQTARGAMQRAALTRIQTALDAGTGFDAALADLESAAVTVPEALTKVAQDGVASLARLQDRFPDAARRALSVSRRVTDADFSGFGSFLRTQLGARSLEPREGDDPDAVLSRAEAATREGRLKDALAEIETLPEEGRAELADWSEDAKRRLEAVAAAEALAQDMN